MRTKSVVAAIAAGASLAGGAWAGDSIEPRFFRNVRQLTRDEMGFTRAGEAYFSADGKRVCFQAYPKGSDAYQIYVMDLDGKEATMVSTGKGATTCSFFSPDGSRLIFASNHLDPRPVGPGAESRPSGGGGRSYAWSFYPGMDIFTYSFADRSLKPLIQADGYDAECSFSPDGKLIVFSSMRDGDQEIYIADSSGRNPRRITSAKGYDGGPFFSPDGKRIVYRSDRNGDGNLQIYVNSIAGDDEHRITHDDGVLHWCPYWHPSGKWLIYTRADHGTEAAPKRPNYDLYLLRDDGSQEIRVTDDETFDGLPVFSNDGELLMWTTRRNGVSSPHIFFADFTGLSPAGELSAAARETP